MKKEILPLHPVLLFAIVMMAGSVFFFGSAIYNAVEQNKKKDTDNFYLHAKLDDQAKLTLDAVHRAVTQEEKIRELRDSITYFNNALEMTLLIMQSQIDQQNGKQKQQSLSIPHSIPKEKNNRWAPEQ